jgi:hypothetical protein
LSLGGDVRIEDELAAEHSDPAAMTPGADDLAGARRRRSFLLFGFLSILTFNDQIPKLIGGE